MCQRDCFWFWVPAVNNVATVATAAPCCCCCCCCFVCVVMCAVPCAVLCCVLCAMCCAVPGKFGLGAKMALIWSKMTTGLPFTISSALHKQDFISRYELDIDIHK